MTNDNPTDSVVSVIQAVYNAWAVQPGIHKKNNDEIRMTTSAGFAGPLKGSRVPDEPQSVRFFGSDTAVVITEGGVLMAGQSELPADRLVRATWILTKKNEQWYVAAYQNSPAN
jgi:uncharacterized protein (TIGR02246 family)